MSRPPVTRKEIFGWAMFDFANSSYTTVVISVLYSKFFVGYIVPAGSTVRQSYWSIAIIISTVIALVLSPLVGAICDYSGKKKRYLFATAVTCSLATAGLALAQPGMVWTAIALVAVSNAGFMLSETFTGSFLPDLSTPETMGKISGLGWGVGYFGGLASIIMATTLIVTADPGAELFRYVRQNQLAMVAIGVFFMVAAAPTFLLVRNRTPPAPGYEHAGLVRLFRAGFREFRETFSTVRRNRVLFQFLFSFMVYMGGIEAITKFVSIYASREVQLTDPELRTLFIGLQLSAAIGAFLFGWLESRIGPKRTVMATLGWWIVGVLGIYFLAEVSSLTGMGPKAVFQGLGLIAGSAIGATQASSRTVVGLLSPPGRVSQMFGFWGTFSRLGAILGMSFGFVADGFQSPRTAVLLVLFFFVAGLLLLSRVDIERGVREVQSAA